jgi:nitroimidazol reductase NimA-like FMN-containing flavoprotein (pyridoxamine 5'-phosphate oxidase superfamily)
MTLAEETEMTDAEVDEFLGGMETGVISFAREAHPYSIPVSFGYETDERAFYLRLVSTAGSTKRAFLDSEPHASLVVYDDEDDRTYRSVVATGVLAGVDPGALSADDIEQYGETRRPLFEVWNDDTDDLDIELYELRPDELTGRRTDVEW